MNIPSPAMLKTQADARKAREAELASSLANAKETLPPTKAPSKRPAPSGKRNSAPSASSPKGKGSPARTSNSSAVKKTTSSPTTSTPSTPRLKKETSTSPKVGVVKSSGSPTKSSPSSTKPSADTKKPFERPEHLTQRPLRDNEALLNLRKELEQPARGQFKREYRSNGRQSGKGLKTKKEHN